MTRAFTMRKTSLGLIAAITVGACASTAVMPSARDAESSSSDVITTAELEHLDRGLSMIEAVEHARPWFLHPRGSVLTVSIDGAPPTESSVLRGISVGQVKEVRLRRAAGRAGPTAIRADGALVVGDVIFVVTGR